MNAQQRITRPTRRIDIANPQELLAWAERLDVEADVLCDAVVLVGNDAEAVEVALKGAVSVSAPH